MYSSPKVKTPSDFKILLWSKIGSSAFNLYRILVKQKFITLFVMSHVTGKPLIKEQVCCKIWATMV